MAIEKADLKLISQLRQQYPLGENLCILGDCYFHFNNSEMSDIIGKSIALDCDPSAKTDLDSFAKALGFKSAHTLDIAGNPTKKINLGETIPSILHNQYDWIIDAGTLYWCFDIATVWKNILIMLRNNGCIIHFSALSGYFGRGYYCFQPRLFKDFYEKNGFDSISLGIRTRPPSILGRRGPYINRIRQILRKITRREHLLDWQILNKENLHLRKTSYLSMEFDRSPTMIEPDMIPNNALISCFARRIKTISFTMPIL